MRTTLDINDKLLAEAKALAARERSTVTRLIEEGLALRLRKRGAGTAPCAFRLPVYRGRGGLVRGVRSTSNRALFEAANDLDT